MAGEPRGLRADDAGDPQAPLERRAAARHLLQHPLTCKEHDPDVFRLVRRHEADLDRWFTQRLGYRLQVGSDTARLLKSGVVPAHRPLRTRTGRAFHQREYVLLALVLAATAAGPAVVSLRDLVEQVRSAAAEAELDVEVEGDHTERRALVAVLQWMVANGLATELHANVDAYATDDTADAVLRLRPDRIAQLALPALVGAANGAELVAAGERRSATRQWLRGRLVEDPVLYRDDVTDDEWAELRRRLGDEGGLLWEMFGLVLEARAEGVAAVDPDGTLADRPFPTGGTVGHAALLLLDALRAHAVDDGVAPWATVVEETGTLTTRHARSWKKDLVAAPQRLAREVVDLLVALRLAERAEPPAVAGNEAGDEPDDASDGTAGVRLLPAAARFSAATPEEPSDGDGDGDAATPRTRRPTRASAIGRTDDDHPAASRTPRSTSTPVTGRTDGDEDGDATQAALW